MDFLHKWSRDMRLWIKLIKQAMKEFFMRTSAPKDISQKAKRKGGKEVNIQDNKEEKDK